MFDPRSPPKFDENGVIWIAGTPQFGYILYGMICPQKGRLELQN
jgi:hypothetical protein